MGYHIIMDSVGDRTQELLEMDNFSVVPLSIIVDEEEVIDNDELSQAELLEKIASAKECPKSACPSPMEYKNLFEKHKDNRIYLVSASSGGTGAYNSAKVGEGLFLEEYPDAEIEIVDSKSASAGQTILVYKIIELERKYNDFTKVVSNLNKFQIKQDTVCAIKDITFLRKNGRLTAVKALVASALNIVPILGANEDGCLTQRVLTRGMKRAVRTLRKIVIKGVENGKKQMLVISHCNSIEIANKLKEDFLLLFPELDVKIVSTGGLATFYAGDGGIILSY